ncbi:hypothetical protein [Corallococcus sicarius]
MNRRLLGVCVGAMVMSAWGCGGKDDPTNPVEDPGDLDPRPGIDAGTGGGTDAGTDAGTGGGTDAGTDAGTGGGTDAGTDAGTDGGTGGGTDGGTDPGPVVDRWPTDPVTNYSERYGIGRVQSVGLDQGKNLWVLDGSRIGVVRADTQKLVWVSGPVGQAASGGNATVICGGAAGRAYVGYSAPDLQPDPEYPGLHTNFIVTDTERCEVPVGDTQCYPFSPRRLQYYKDGDVDAVKLDAANGQVLFEEHLNKSVRNNVDENGKPFIQRGPSVVAGVSLGIRNSNDHHFDEDRSILSCVSVMTGANKGDVYVGSNHGVTRLRNLEFNAHRHPVWFDANGSQYAGYTYGLGLAQDGDVLMANDWTFGMVTPTPSLGDWDNTDTRVNPSKVKSSYLPELNSQAAFDYWRGFQQTKDGRYYLGSKSLGLWQMEITNATNPTQRGIRIGAEVGALDAINSLAATNDGSLFIATNAGGLYRLTPAKTLEKVDAVRANRILQLVYDPSVTPGMLLVLTSDGLTVLRGY